MTRIIKRPAAKQDLIEEADYIAQDNLEADLEVGNWLSFEYLSIETPLK